MVTLYAFGAMPGLPDLSPFVIKTMVQLKMAGIDYAVDTKGFRRAPKGKLPYINDNGVIVADSTFIRAHIEKTRNVDLDEGLTPLQRAQSLAAEKLCEDHLMWIGAYHRWMDDDNFAHGPGAFFDQTVPGPARGLVKWLIRRSVTKRFWGQGVGRFTDAERAALGGADVNALSELIGDKRYLMGDNPCAADAAVFAFLALLFDPATKSATRDAALAKPNLVAYRDRMMEKYFPNIAKA